MSITYQIKRFGKLELFQSCIFIAVALQTLFFVRFQSAFIAGLRDMLFVSLSDATVCCVLAMLLPKRLRWFSFVLPFASLVLLIVNCCYAQYFNDFIAFSIIRSYKNLDVMGWGIIVDSFHWYMLLILLPICLPIIVYILYHKQIECEIVQSKTLIVRLLCVSVLFVLGQCSIPYHYIDPNLRSSGWFGRMVDRYSSAEPYMHSYVTKWGVIPTYFTTLMPWFYNPALLESDWESIENFILEDRGTLPEQYKVAFKANSKKRLIMIIVESLSSHVINKSVNGESVTPFLDSLINNNGTIYFPNIVTQVKNGSSSDGQLMYNTGLYPMRSEVTVAISSLKRIHSLADNFNCGNEKNWK